MATFEGILDTCIRVTTTGDTRVTTTGDVRILSPDKREFALASDSLLALWNAQVAVPESLGADDSIAALWDAQGILAESVGASDSVSNATHFYATISESVSVSDALVVAWSAQGVVSESAIGSDTPLATWNALCDLAESVGADDAYVLARIYDKIISESLTALETLTVDGIYKGGILVIEGNDTFAVGDILYVKEGFDAEWLEVTNNVHAPSYRVIRDKAGDYADGSNPVWTKGASVVNYGQSGDGGIYVTASDTNAPHLSIFTHAGEPWDTITTHIREGNLNGYAGYETDVYGWAAYIDANNYIKIDPVSGIRMSGEITITGGGTNLDAIADGSSYKRVPSTTISAGKIVLTSGVSGSLPVANSEAKCTDANADQTSANAQASGWLSDVADNTYGMVAKTAISAGKIVLTSAGVSGTLPTALSVAKCTDANADQTSVNTAADTSKVGGLAAASIAGWAMPAHTTYINGGNIYTSTIVANSIAANAITAVKVGANEIIANTANIKDAVITNAKISALDAGKITTGYLAAARINTNTITAAMINTTTLSAIVANLGSITGGTITLSSTGWIKGGQTAYATGTGFFLGYSSGYKFSVGSSTEYIKWDGSALSVGGDIIATGNIVAGSVTVPVSAFTAAGVTCTATTIQSVSITSHGSPIQINFSFQVYGYSSSSILGYVLVKRGATTIATIRANVTSQGANYARTHSFSLSDTPAAGTYTYSLYTSYGATSVATNRSLVLTELRR